MHDLITKLEQRNPLSSIHGLFSIGLVASLPQVSLADSSHVHVGSSYVPIWSGVFALLLLLGIYLLIRRMRYELKHTSSALTKSKRHLKLMGDKLPNVTLFQLCYSPKDDFSFRYLSAGLENSLKINRDLLFKSAAAALDYIYEEDISVLREASVSAKTKSDPIDLELRILDQDGNLRWLEVSAVPHREKELIIWDGLVKDITANKKMEQTLIEENHNFEQLFESIGDFLFVCDMNGKLLHSNSAVRKHLGYSAEELSSMSLFELYPDSIRTTTFEVIAQMQTQETATNSLPLCDRQGNSVPVEMNIFQGMWKDKQAIFCIGRDIARRKQTEIALRQSQQMLQLIMDTIPMAVFWTDKDSVYLGCNKTFIQECGLQSTIEVIGNNPTDLFSQERSKELLISDQHVITSNKPLFNKINSFTRPDGSVGWRETSKIPLQNESGNAVGVLGVWRDVTEQHHAQDRLKRTLEDMERFNQLMRGRERRTLQLKSEINDLLKELGRQKKYRTTQNEL